MRLRPFLFVCGAAVACLLGASSNASAKPALDVAHVLGREAPWVIGWNEAVVTLDNKDRPAWRGEVIVDPTFDHHALDRPGVRVPVTLAAGESARIVLPFFLPNSSTGTVMLLENGRDVDQAALGLNHSLESANVIVEIQGPTAYGPKLVEVPAPPEEKLGYPGFAPTPTGVPPVPTVTAPTLPASAYAPPVVSTVQFARETGDPILPDVAVGWSGATMIVAPSDVVGRLQGQQFEALAQFVLSGGSLAVSLVREEDLRTPNLVRLLGGEAHVLGNTGSEVNYSGARLQKPSFTVEDFGDVANYGLGEVWMLRRDPWARPLEAKSPHSLWGIWWHSKERRAEVMSLPFGRGLNWIDQENVRALLDPNQGFRPALGIAAVLVVVYAFLVGPLLFRRARKLGRPLSVLRLTPVLAVILFAVLVGIGRVGKGVRGRVRKLEIVEVAGGAERAAVTTFHAFYVADPSSIELFGEHSIDAVHVVEPSEETSPIDLERNAILVRNIRSHPWQTVVVQEEGARDLQGSIVLEGSGIRLTLINNTPFTLEHVVLHPQNPDMPARSRYFASVPPGGTVVARDGKPVDRRIVPSAIGQTDNVLDFPTNGKDPTAIAFNAIEQLITNWFVYGAASAVPLDQPIATAIVHAPTKAESGFSVDEDILFLRVMGLGGGKGKGDLDNPLEKKGPTEGNF